MQLISTNQCMHKGKVWQKHREGIAVVIADGERILSTIRSFLIGNVEFLAKIELLTWSC